MAYVPDWERLSDVLNRVVAAGVSKDEGKLDISRAIADGKIKVRLTITDQSSDIRGTLTFGQFHVPSHLTPEDFDWENSRPLKPWQTGPRDWKSNERHSFSWRNRPISLIEARTADVILWIERTFATKARDAPPSCHPNLERPTADSKTGAGAKARGIDEAIDQLWSKGIPQGLSAKERDLRIVAQLNANGGSIPKDIARAVQRALARRRQK